MNIPDIVLKIKTLSEEHAKWLISAGILILIGILCFFIGKIASQEPPGEAPPIKIIYPPQVPVSSTGYQAKTSNTPQPPLKEGEQHQKISTVKTEWLYAGSKTGKTYYTKDCKGINRVKPENRVYFTTRDAAISAGYSLSKTCHDSI